MQTPRKLAAPGGSLFWRIALAGIGSFLVTGIAVSTILAAGARSRAEEFANSRAELVIERILTPALAPSDLSRPVSSARSETLADVVDEGVLSEDMLRVKIWRPDGTILFSDVQALAGAKFAAESDELREIVQTGKSTGRVADLALPENETERQLADKVFESFAPIRLKDNGPFVAVVEIDQDYAPIQAASTSVFVPLGITFAVALLVFLVALPLVLRAVRSRDQEDDWLPKGGRGRPAAGDEEPPVQGGPAQDVAELPATQIQLPPRPAPVRRQPSAPEPEPAPSAQMPVIVKPDPAADPSALRKVEERLRDAERRAGESEQRAQLAEDRGRQAQELARQHRERLQRAEAETRELESLRERLGEAEDRLRHAEQQADHAESGYRAIVEKTPAVTYVDSLDGIHSTIYISPQVQALLGYPAEQWTSDPGFRTGRIHPDDRESVESARASAHANGRSIDIEYRMIAADGREVWVGDQAVVVTELNQVHGVLFDITMRKEREGELIEGAARFRDLVVGSPDAILVHMGGRLVFVNRAAARLLGADEPRQLAGVRLPDLVHPESQDRMQEWSRGEGLTGPATPNEEAFVRLDGSVVQVEVTENLITYDSKPAAQLVLRDITERKRAEAKVQVPHEQQDLLEQQLTVAGYRSLVERIPAVLHIDRVEDVPKPVYVGPQIEAVLGIPADRYLADPSEWSRLVHPEDRERILELWRRGVEAKRPFDLDYRMVLRNGRVVRIHDEIVVIDDDDDGTPLAQGIMLDNTDRRLDARLAPVPEPSPEAEPVPAPAEAATPADGVKDALTAAVAYELRAPLTSILGFALTLKHENIQNGERQDLVRRLAASARKLDRLVADLLEIDRLAHGTLKPNRRATDVASLMRRVVEDTEMLAGRVVEVEGESVAASVDPTRVEQIAEALLANAARRTTPGMSVWVRVRREGEGVLIAVEDEGAEIPKDLRDLTFEPFWQREDAPVHVPGGGFALALAARFAEMHGGWARVVDRRDGGVSFQVYLAEPPVDLAERAQAEETSLTA